VAGPPAWGMATTYPGLGLDWPGPPVRPCPKQPEALVAPANHGLRFHDDQQLGPAGPNLTEACPEEPVQPIQTGTGSFPLEHGALLSEGENLEGGVAATTEEDSNGGQERKEEFDHESPL